ncbi:hypothetical protein CVT25_014223 [Psilocybe cyanescens]|uniref:non-specific serine/threonine protein kinase n=1 Tax=Psilocybe cyanescens TaxID=93625 RepID=A0A409XL02_PSICY|nr:hypothetical protein CVT25_014223 [Psilocybe cyanescens]
MSSSSFLDSYEPLDVIGNGSFGIIRKVRRKSDGLLFARKELNFERMSERDRKQIVSELTLDLGCRRNILKDLHHDHIVRYHDRHVDRDAGILYILMEYCGGGDLSAVIKQAAKQNRPIPEDTIWHYFLQILHALHHCHHPNGHGHTRSSSGSGLTGTSLDAEGSSRRVQILHRDLKPDNVFLDENNTVKLGDFGLSKALAQASFASTYVGTPYYMSPELMQEKSYDSKSDIWSLGCLIYELCALKPPFHEAKTHSELSIFIRNGRIPPLPRGYSQALTSVIKSMLNLNPAMRPSAAQLLQHERLELVNKVAETEKMLSAVKAHRAAVSAKEREVLEREHNLRESEQHLTAVLNSKDQEITALQHLVAQLREQLQSSSQTQQQQPQYTRQDIEHAAKQAIARREEELRVLVMKREEEVALAIAKREEEIMEAVRAREVEIDQACVRREEVVRKEVEERVQWVLDREAALRAEERRLEDVKREVEAGMRKVEAGLTKGRKEKNPLEEVKNLLEPLSRATAQVTPSQPRRRKQEPQLTPRPNPSQQANSNHTSNNNHTNTSTSNSGATNTTTTNNNNNNNTNNNHTIMTTNSTLETPTASRPFATYSSEFMPASAMKGVVLTATGETLATPSPAELVSLFTRSPKVGLDFGKIFEFREGSGNVNGNPKQKQPQPQLNLQQQQHHQQFQQHRAQAHVLDDDEELDSPPPSPSERKERERRDNTTTTTTTTASWPPTAPPPTRIRRPSIRTSARSAPARSSGFPPSTASSSDSSSGHSNAAGPSSNHTSNHNNTTTNNPKPLPHPHLRSSRSISNLASAHAAAHAAAAAGRVPLPPAPVYDLADEENLPSPFLKRTLPNASRPNSHHSSSSANACASSSSNTAAVGLGGAGAASTKGKRRGSSGLLLRAVAAANNAGRTRSAGALPSPESDGEIAQGQGQGEGPSPTAASYASTTVGGVCFPLSESGVGESARPSLASARKASEEARKALLRP